MLYHQSSKYTDYDGDYVYCMNCGCRTKLFECFNGTGKTHEDTKVEAIESWNRRKRAFIQRLLCMNVAPMRKPVKNTVGRECWII